MTLSSFCAWGTLLCLAIAVPAYVVDLIKERRVKRPR
jgi:hypothetical protein